MKIYIITPANCVTGGPELAHQLCSDINRLTETKAYMCYIGDTQPYCINADCPAPEPYAIYGTTHETSFEEMDRPENVVVVPEALTASIELIENAKIVLWWMSVDNYVKTTGEKDIDIIKDRCHMHLFQSYYALDYVNHKIPGVKGMYLSDYINEAHGQFLYPAEFRGNKALYNPAKGYNELRPLIEKADWLEWIPLVNLDIPHMVLFMQSSKIYVDFGGHPGKDRIPREAASNGCVVITNKKGAAAFDKDVPIPEKYKFDNPIESLDEINNLMHDICDNFKYYQDDFSGYRSMIKEEKNKFDEDVIKFVAELSK